MATSVDNTLTIAERREREAEDQAKRAAAVPILTAHVEKAVSYYTEGWRTGYLLKVGEVFSSVQPIGAIGGSLPDPIRVDILDIKPLDLAASKWPTVGDYLKACGRENLTIKVATDQSLTVPKKKKERPAKETVSAQDAVKGEKKPEVPKPTETEILQAFTKTQEAGKNLACKNGHTFTLDTIYVGTLMSKGKLGCKTCDLARKAAKQ